MDKSWMETNRISKSYVNGVAAFTDYAWTKHGEEDEPSISAPKPVNATTEFVDDMDFAYIPTDGPTTIEMISLFTKDVLNKCLLYWKNDKDLTACRTCGTSRWKVDNKTKKVYENIPAKVMWYFPIIPRLQRLFKIESISEDLRWHVTRRITDGVLRHPADSQLWRTIDEKFPEIVEDTRNLWLGLTSTRETGITVYGQF
ncbi:hypothetical protein Tco_1357485 [Tanacetum coccineum]